MKQTIDTYREKKMSLANTDYKKIVIAFGFWIRIVELFDR